MHDALGPTLPELLERRFGVPRRRTLVAFVGFVVVVLVIVFAVQKIRERPQLVHRGKPTFNLVYNSPEVRKVAPHAGELARLEAHRPRVTWTLVVRPLALPAFEGDLGHALLPIIADRHAEALRRTVTGFTERDEGRAQINRLPGYQIGFLARDGAKKVNARDVMVLPADSGVRLGVLISYRQTSAKRRLGERDLEVAKLVKKAQRSFTFGTARA